ncbi:MAG: hypothetical protein DMG67_09580 [Acidobacteria bacterium]|nr:MAG: hypothetical protein DMG67_09580 [Acidobacteriota bacterium]
MPVNPSAVLVLVCPQCGKKYKGDANRPDARYECPVDQSTLIRLDMQAIAAVRQARQPGAAAAKPQLEAEAGINPDPNGASSEDDTPTQSYAKPISDPNVTRSSAARAGAEATVLEPQR